MTRNEDPEPQLEPALDFLQRFWELNHVVERVSARMERTLGVTAQQRLVVRCVGKYPGLTAGRLAALLHVDPGTVSTTATRLEQKGLLQRQSDPHDGRRVVLGLTAKGRALDIRATGTVENAVERLLSTTSGSEVVATKSLLRRLSAFLAEEARSSGARSSGRGPDSSRR